MSFYVVKSCNILKFYYFKMGQRCPISFLKKPFLLKKSLIYFFSTVEICNRLTFIRDQSRASFGRFHVFLSRPCADIPLSF